MIYDAGNENENIIMEDIFEQNLEETNLTLAEFEKQFKCVHKYKKRDMQDNISNWVVERKVIIRNLLRRKDRIYIGWQSCRIKDYSPRCYNS